MSVAELKPREGKKVPRYQTFVETVDVEIDADDLHEAGWHHKNECPGMPDTDALDSAYDNITLRRAVESLHHQAHGPGPLPACFAEPCKSLSLDQLRGVA